MLRAPHPDKLFGWVSDLEGGRLFLVPTDFGNSVG